MDELSNQTPLFTLDTPSSSSVDFGAIAWSYSRRSTFERCLRLYYYVYFATNKRFSLEDPDKNEILFLNGLKSRYLRAGEIVHMVIRTFLRKAQGGDYWSADRLASWGTSLLRTDRNYSREHPDGDMKPDTRFPPQLLQEYHYRNVDVEAIYEAIETRVVNALRTFATSPVFDDFRRNGTQPGALVEKHFTYSRLGFRVDGQIDLAYKTGDIVTIVDWKSGDDEWDGDDSLQLAVYALWATEFFNSELNQIRVVKAFLGSASVIEFDASTASLESAKIRIIQDAERLASVRDYAESGQIDVFTPVYQPLVCDSCSFHRLCYGT